MDAITSCSTMDQGDLKKKTDEKPSGPKALSLPIKNIECYISLDEIGFHNSIAISSKIEECSISSRILLGHLKIIGSLVLIRFLKKKTFSSEIWEYVVSWAPLTLVKTRIVLLCC